MSILEKLAPKTGAYQARKRVGRGRGSGLGQTAGKGHKGQLARAGGKVRRGFEGGQSPLVRRLPKFGFKCPSRVNYEIINLQNLEGLSGVINLTRLIELGLVSTNRVKLLGSTTKIGPLSVSGIKLSVSAKDSILAAGGKIEE